MENAEEQNVAVDKVNEAVNLGGNIELVGFKQVSLGRIQLHTTN